MFMAKKPIITEEVKKQNNMAFKMRSGNKVSFKNMGSSSVKQKENLPRDPGDRGTEVKWDNVRQEYIPTNMPNAKSPSTPQPTGPKPTSPTKQKLNKGGEGQDQNKIFNDKGEHVGDYINDKPVMRPGFKRPVVKKDKPVKPKDGDYEKYSDLEKYDDDNPTGKAEPPKKKGISKGIRETILKSPAKQKRASKPVKPGEKPIAVKNIPFEPRFSDEVIRKGIAKKKEIDKENKKKKSPAKQAKTKGLGPRTAFGGVKNPELIARPGRHKPKKPFSTKVMKDGPEKQVTGIDLGKDPNWQPHPDAFKTKKKK